MKRDRPPLELDRQRSTPATLGLPWLLGAGAACTLSLANAAQGAIFSYTIEPGTSVSFMSDVETLSGTFTINTDPSPGTPSLIADITLAGIGVEAGTYNGCTVVSCTARNQLHIERLHFSEPSTPSGSFVDELALEFTGATGSPLTTLANTGHSFFSVFGASNNFVIAATGGAVISSAAAVPEPSTAWVLTAGFALVAFGRIRAARRSTGASREPGDSPFEWRPGPDDLTAG